MYISLPFANTPNDSAHCAFVWGWKLCFLWKSGVDSLAAVYFQCVLKKKKRERQVWEKHWRKVFTWCQLSELERAIFILSGVFLWRLWEPVCSLRDADMLLSWCFLVFIANRECLLFCIYNACSLWGCYRCHSETPYQSLLVGTHTNIIVLPPLLYILMSICNTSANYGFPQQCGPALPHLVSN